LNFAGRMPGGLWYTGQLMRLRWAERLPFTFGRLTRRPVDPNLVNRWFEPLRTSPGVRRDFARLLPTLSSTHTLAAVDGLRRLEAPALVVWSEDDPIFPFEHAERLVVDLPDARLAVVEDSYGFVPLDQPERLVDILTAFLQKQSVS
jgi:pimeloyl-ACP methyl ester carboxylesterase